MQCFLVCNFVRKVWNVLNFFKQYRRLKQQSELVNMFNWCETAQHRKKICQNKHYWTLRRNLQHDLLLIAFSSEKISKSSTKFSSHGAGLSDSTSRSSLRKRLCGWIYVWCILECWRSRINRVFIFSAIPLESFSAPLKGGRSRRLKPQGHAMICCKTTLSMVCKPDIIQLTASAQSFSPDTCGRKEFYL